MTSSFQSDIGFKATDGKDYAVRHGQSVSWNVKFQRNSILNLTVSNDSLFSAQFLVLLLFGKAHALLRSLLKYKYMRWDG